MVTPSGSRPAALTQRQVDDLASGRHEDVARLLHAARSVPPTDIRVAERSSPVVVQAKEMQAIVRTGTATGRVAQRIAESAQPETPRKSKPKSAPARKPAGSAPSQKPPRGATR